MVGEEEVVDEAGEEDGAVVVGDGAEDEGSRQRKSTLKHQVTCIDMNTHQEHFL